MSDPMSAEGAEATGAATRSEIARQTHVALHLQRRAESAEAERDKWMKSRRYWKGRAESAETQLDELRGQHAETEWLLRMTYDARDRAERKVEAAEALVVESLARPQPGYVSALALRAALDNPSHPTTVTACPMCGACRCSAGYAGGIHVHPAEGASIANPSAAQREAEVSEQ